jgi:hypothetical protein
MSEMQDKLDFLEARIDHQAARIDALYRALEREGILPRPVTGDRRETSPDETWEVARVASSQPGKKPARTRRAAGFHLGTATGV